MISADEGVVGGRFVNVCAHEGQVMLDTVRNGLYCQVTNALNLTCTCMLLLHSGTPARSLPLVQIKFLGSE